MDGPTIGELEWSMLDTKHTTEESSFYTNHGYARGGVGVLVSTGGARGAINRLPANNARVGSRGTSRSARSATASSYNNSASGSPRAFTPPGNQSIRSASARPAHTTTLTATANGMTAGSEDFGYNDSHSATSPHGTKFGTSSMRASTATPMVARHEWERVYPHAYDFQGAARQVRVHDIARANKWAAVSYFENDPKEIKRHLDIVNIMDQIHAQGKGHERRDETIRHQTWATRQREVFRRQRQESANKYRGSGLKMRETYVMHPPTPSPTAENTAYLYSESACPNEMMSNVGGSERAMSAGFARSEGGLVMTPRSFTSSGMPCTSSSLYQTYKSAVSEGLMVCSTSSPPSSPAIALPRPSFFKLSDRMLQESEEGVQGRVAAHHRRLEEEEVSKEKREAAQAVRQLNSFEDEIKAVQKSLRTSQIDIHS